MSFLFYSVAFAETQASRPHLLESLMPLVFIFLAFYFIFIRPQKKKMKIQQEFLAALKKGDSVLTSFGLLGTVSGLTDQFVTLEIDQGVKVRVLRSQISSPFKEHSALMENQKTPIKKLSKKTT